jgi:hypothetical protein
MTTANIMELNPNKQYILCGDISASMQSHDPKCGGLSRYAYMLEKFKSFVQESKDFDPDGPTVLMYGENVHQYSVPSLEAIDNKLNNPIFEGFTNTHLVVGKAWEIHSHEKAVLKKEGKTHAGTVVFLFTDGQPTNEAALERKIIEIANAVDRDDEFSIGFVLVGTIDAHLRNYLNKLDDGLTGKVKFDIVGTTEIEGLTFMKAVNNAINE